MMGTLRLHPCRRNRRIIDAAFPEGKRWAVMAHVLERAADKSESCKMPSMGYASGAPALFGWELLEALQLRMTH